MAALADWVIDHVPEVDVRAYGFSWEDDYVYGKLPHRFVVLYPRVFSEGRVPQLRLFA